MRGRHLLSLSSLPSVDRLLQGSGELIARHGRPAVTNAIRAVLEGFRRDPSIEATEGQILQRVESRLLQEAQSSLRPVFNLTGTVLHTNLGRAPLPEEAIEAMAAVARGASTLEYDLGAGRRGERDTHVEGLVCELTGAEAATVVNNNAAALLLVLNTLARGKEVPVSRGELIEIGGSFRLPDILARSGCRLREIGTTNRTHLRDYAEAVGPKTALVLKAHTSNYAIEGFTAAVPENQISKLCRDSGIPFLVDLGSGTLVDLERYGLPHEPTAREVLAHGADLVTFSGDKLLGGPQAGIVAGRAALIGKVRRNPLKRALRADKLTLAALRAVLHLYRDPERLRTRLPTLRLLARPVDEIRASAFRIGKILEGRFAVEVIDCESQVGSGALPTKTIPSAGIAIRPGTARVAKAFRDLPVPVIGRVQDGAFILDLRCLEDEAGFIAQIQKL